MICVLASETKSTHTARVEHDISLSIAMTENLGALASLRCVAGENNSQVIYT